MAEDLDRSPPFFLEASCFLAALTMAEVTLDQSSIRESSSSIVDNDGDDVEG